MFELNIDKIEYIHLIHQFSKPAIQNGILWRSAYTPEEKKAKQFLMEFMKENGLISYEDSVGNLYGYPERAQYPPEQKSVLVGSHIDTVRDGGLFDGALGVLAGIIAVSSLVQQFGLPQKKVEVVGLIEEEGSRFHSGCIGSRAIVHGLEDFDLTEKDVNGISIAEAMSKSGYYPKNVQQAKRDDISAYIEMHIEQGPLLERSLKKIGIVEAITGILILNIEISGEENHAGTTPMESRKDALVAACGVISEIPEAVQKVSKTARATVGMIQAHPGSTNVIPGNVKFSIDIRDIADTGMVKVKNEIQKLLKKSEETGFSVSIEEVVSDPPIALDLNLMEMIENICRENAVSGMTMASGAGHDAQIFAERFPSALFFIPSKNGISHSPKEYSDPNDIILGTRILAELLKEIAWK